MLMTVPVFCPDPIGGFSLILGLISGLNTSPDFRLFLPFIWHVALFAFCVLTGNPCRTGG